MNKVLVERNYSAGRPIPAEVLTALIAFMRTRATKLLKLAKELEG